VVFLGNLFLLLMIAAPYLLAGITLLAAAGWLIGKARGH
jgi:hypothetical protein